MGIKTKHTLVGTAFGLAFPIISIGFLMLSQNYTFSQLGVMHEEHNLLYIINLAPIILGFMAFLIGSKQAKIKKELENREQEIEQRTLDLSAKNKSLKNEIETRKMVEKKLVKATKDAISSKKVEQRFLANMSHEIRTPLNSIIGFSNILIKSDLDPKHLGYLKSVQFASNHLLSIVNDILDMSKINAGEISFEKTNINLRDLVHGVIETVRITSNDKNLELSYELFTDEDIIIKTDSVRMNQVLLNLLNNAIKFTPEGNVKLKISHLNADSDGDQMKLLFEIIDTGIGISSKNLDKVFNDFAQAESNTTRKFGGTGLGLSISKKIVELQNGKIGVKSELGKGSNFWFQIDFEKGSDENVVLRARKSVLNHNLENEIRILIAEDNEMNRFLVKTIFEQLGESYKVTFAFNGLEAFEKVQTNEFDIVLMDLQMPVMDGFEATEKIRALETEIGNIPIIALTADVLAKEKNRAYQVGMDAYVTKPIKPEILLSKIFESLKISVL